MHQKLIPLCLVLLCFLACKKDKPTDQTNTDKPSVEVQKPFTAVLDSLLKQGGGPCESDFDCMKIRAVWPVVQHGDKKIRKIINDSIATYVINHVDYIQENDKANLSAAMDSFIMSYAREYKETEGNGLGWALDVEGKIEFNEDIANLTLFNYSFMGGAHPNYFTQYSNFDLKTGAQIVYEDIIKDDTAFKNIIQKAFYKTLIERTGDESAADTFIPEEGLPLAENFKITKDTIELLYNTYEVTPYVMGDIPIKIPMSALKGIVEL